MIPPVPLFAKRTAEAPTGDVQVPEGVDASGIGGEIEEAAGEATETVG